MLLAAAPMPPAQADAQDSPLQIVSPLPYETLGWMAEVVVELDSRSLEFTIHDLALFVDGQHVTTSLFRQADIDGVTRATIRFNASAHGAGEHVVQVVARSTLFWSMALSQEVTFRAVDEPLPVLDTLSTYYDGSSLVVEASVATWRRTPANVTLTSSELGNVSASVRSGAFRLALPAKDAEPGDYHAVLRAVDDDGRESLRNLTLTIREPETVFSWNGTGGQTTTLQVEEGIYALYTCALGAPCERTEGVAGLVAMATSSASCSSSLVHTSSGPYGPCLVRTRAETAMYVEINVLLPTEVRVVRIG